MQLASGGRDQVVHVWEAKVCFHPMSSTRCIRIASTCSCSESMDGNSEGGSEEVADGFTRPYDARMITPI